MLATNIEIAQDLAREDHHWSLANRSLFATRHASRRRGFRLLDVRPLLLDSYRDKMQSEHATSTVESRASYRAILPEHRRMPTPRSEDRWNEARSAILAGCRIETSSITPRRSALSWKHVIHVQAKIFIALFPEVAT
ncbi:hypothetical protein KM043_003080 [Ampulex compressa]|nr:hypothetical protein KM043_003080 [Ampulex compressa]